jgi:N-acetylglucosaminyl-diphospho-decaprenol L-rhamnosyltransferase
VKTVDENLGFGGACNVALQEVETPLIAFGNPDVRLATGALSTLADVICADDSVAVAGPLWSLDRPTIRRNSGLLTDLIGATPRLMLRYVRRWSRDMPVEMAGDAVVDVPFVVGAFMVCRCDAIRAVGGFDSRFFLYYEEEDLCRRLRASGWKIMVAKAALAEHAVSASSRGESAATLAPARLRSRYVFYRKYHGWLYQEVARAMMAAIIIVSWASRALRGRPAAYARGSLHAMYSSGCDVRPHD